MKFFFNITLVSSCLSLNFAYPCDALNILEPSHLLSYRYSMPHSPQPKNVYPNIVYSTWEIPFEEDEMNVLSVSLPKYLCSMKEDIQREYGYGLYLQHLLEYEHLQNYKSVSTSHDSDAEYLLGEPDNDILSPKQYGNSNYLSNGNSFGNWTYNKTKTFIETKVTAIKLQGFNL